MIKTTIGKALDEIIDTTDHYLYLYRDENFIFYVGRSQSPIDRLMSHLGKDNPWIPDLIGKTILENMPQSRNWAMEMYTLQDCIEFMQTSPLLGFYLENINNLLWKKDLISDAEGQMITIFKPCLNITYNTRNKMRLPDKYQPNRDIIANEGVKLDSK